MGRWPPPIADPHSASSATPVRKKIISSPIVSAKVSGLSFIGSTLATSCPRTSPLSQGNEVAMPGVGYSAPNPHGLRVGRGDPLGYGCQKGKMDAGQVGQEMAPTKAGEGERGGQMILGKKVKQSQWIGAIRSQGNLGQCCPCQ